MLVFLATVWTVVVVVGLALVPLDRGTGHADLQHTREILAGCCIGIGTLLAFLRHPNKKSPRLADADLEIFAIAFLAAGAFLPLMRSFYDAGTVGIKALVIIVALTFIPAGVWSWRGP